MLVFVVVGGGVRARVKRCDDVLVVVVVVVVEID